MKQFTILILILMVFVFIDDARAQNGTGSTIPLPKGIYEQLKQIGWFTVYEIDADMNPAYQRGDFNGDGKIDLALQIVSKNSGKRGILIIHAEDTFLHVIGAGNTFSDLGDDFDWLKTWKVDPFTVKKSRYSSTVEALMVNHPERTGMLIFWDGSQYIAHEMEPYYYYSDSIELTQPLNQDLAVVFK